MFLSINNSAKVTVNEIFYTESKQTCFPINCLKKSKQFTHSAGKWPFIKHEQETHWSYTRQNILLLNILSCSKQTHTSHQKKKAIKCFKCRVKCKMYQPCVKWSTSMDTLTYISFKWIWWIRLWKDYRLIPTPGMSQEEPVPTESCLSWRIRSTLPTCQRLSQQKEIHLLC